MEEKGVTTSQAAGPQHAPEAGDTVTPTDVALSVLVAFNFAVAGPLLDFLARNLDVFTIRSAPRMDIVALVVAVTVVAPLVLGFVAIAAYGIRRRLGLVVHGALLGGLLALLGAQMLARLGPLAGAPAAVHVLGGAAAGVAGALLYFRSTPARSFVRLGVVAPVGFAVLFLVFTPARGLLASAQPVEGGAVGDPVPIVVVLFDGLPAVSLMDEDRDIDAELYPNFARLAEDAAWFRNATTHNASTKYALPGMLTGDHIHDGSATVGHHPEHLFTWLGEEYRIVAYEAVSFLCPDEHCDRIDRQPPLTERWPALSRDVGLLTLHATLPHGLRGGLPPPEDAIGELAGGRPRYEVEDEDGHAEAWDWFLGEFVPDRRPGLHFFHSLKPHFPWVSLPTGQRAYPPRDEPHGGYVFRVWDDDWLTVAQWQRQLLQTGYVDSMLGQLLDTLEDAGIYEDALVIVASDHGEAFTVGSQVRVPSADNLGEAAFVTLFVKEPGRGRGRVVDAPVELIDVLPTIEDVLEADLAGATDGRSLLGDLPADRDREIVGWDNREDISPGGEEILAPLERKIALFGSEGGWERLFRVGPHGDLVGRDVADLSVANPEDARITVDDLDRFDHVDPDAELLPVLLSGRIRTPTASEQPTPLAVAVNGRIAAVAETYRHDGPEGRVFVVLLPDALDAGANLVEVYRILDGPGGPRLQPMETVGA